MLRNKPWYLLYLFLIAHAVPAQNFQAARQPQQVQEFLKKSADNTESIQAKFTEEKKMSVLKGVQKASGNFYFKKQDRMRWEQKLPDPYIILIDGAAVRIKDGGKEKNLEGTRMAQQIRMLILGLINGNFTEDKSFEKLYLEHATAYQVRLLPRNKRLKAIYQEIRLIFDKKSGILEQLTFIEKGGDRRDMLFYDQVINKPLAESLFSKF
ncbi:outer membrane lipoprotein carrier protein LolA [Dyadobacter tibetensis]|uniref:outer membrane lipoprotein carrier protein LolA n=1 Tax=Dyadobacter tibetensis TaxID=1211851 RepID=UPI00046F33A8|nr:outer membrane lipoprotein carrier protein LolA [Dyadobacter tibetensis]